MKYRVCQMQDGNGDVWFQVQSSRYGFFWRWDCSWPWTTKVLDIGEAVAMSYDSPRRFDTLEEARAHIADIKHRDLAKQVRIADVFSDMPTAVTYAVDVTKLFAYSATPDVTTPPEPVVTETKPTTRKATRRGRKKTS